jgi:hypothetical protein
MSKSAELTAVLSHLENLVLKITQNPTDIMHRRELLDGYFSVSPEVMETSITPEKIMVGDRAGYWFVPDNHPGQNACCIFMVVLGCRVRLKAGPLLLLV